MLALPKAHELKHLTRVDRARDVDALVAIGTKSETSRPPSRTEAAPRDDLSARVLPPREMEHICMHAARRHAYRVLLSFSE